MVQKYILIGLSIQGEKMKKLISIIIMLMMIGVVIAQSPPVPMPVRGYLTLNGVGLTGYIIEITNLRTGQTVTGDTISSLVTEANGFSVDLGKVGFIGSSAVYVGDTIQAKVRGFSDPQATVTFIPSTIPYSFEIAIVNQQTVYQCTDGSFVVDLNDCPVPDPEPEPEPEPEVEIESKVTSNDDKSSASVEVDYGQRLDVKIDNKKLSKLIDDEINYDGDNYDVAEEVYLEGIVLTSIDDKDFGTDPYLILEESSVVYKYIFKDEIKIADIHIEEPLEINFLDKDLKIIEASESEIVIRTGEELFLQEGKVVTIEGKEVKVVTIAEESILINVAGEEKIIANGEELGVNGLRVLVENILYKNYEEAINSVELVIGTDIDVVIKDGDYFELFEENEDYRWLIKLSGEQFIGIENTEAYKDIDEDSDYKAIGVKEFISLPNGFLEIEFKSITESDLNELTFKVKDDYLYVKGDEDVFSFGSDEYNRLYINENGIHDEDKEFITDTKVEIGDSDIFLEFGSVLIADLRIELDLSDILFKGISYANKEETYMDYLGIIFSDAEQSVDDKDGFDVIVPEERPVALISFNTEVSEVIEPESTPVEPIPVEPTPVEPTEPTPAEPVTTTPTPTPTPVEPTPVEPTEPVEPKGSAFQTFLITLIAAIIGFFAWGKGFAGLIKYYLRLAKEAEKSGDTESAKKYRARAEKMAKTVVTNYLAGKYKK